jgi:hypothetical protein
MSRLPRASPPAAVSHHFKNVAKTRVVNHPQTERDRILLGGVRQFIDKRFDAKTLGAAGKERWAPVWRHPSRYGATALRPEVISTTS